MIATIEYHLRHPEHDTPSTAVFRGFWQVAGRNAGLRLRFLGEPHDRCLTYREIERLQEAEVAATQTAPPVM